MQYNTNYNTHVTYVNIFPPTICTIKGYIQLLLYYIKRIKKKKIKNATPVG